LILFGLSLQAFGMFYSTDFNIDTDFGTFRVIRIFQMLGLPFLFIPISTLAFMNIPAIKRNKASALFSLARNLGGSVGIAVVISYAARSQQIHQSHLASNLFPGKETYEQLFASLKNFTENPEQINGIIYRMLDEQSAMLAYADTYKFLGMIMIFAIIVSIFLLPGNKISAKSEPVAVH
jgi:DHA2 family multidrug resistance protein